MQDPVQNNAYLAAFLSAESELNDVYEAFERLRVRKERVEAVVEALKPLVDSSQTLSPVLTPVVQSDPVWQPAPAPQNEWRQEVTPAPVAASSEPSSDPIQRRINSILGLAVA